MPLEYIKNCQKCPLHLTRNNIVNGEGTLTRGIMLIGEAPGETEDLTGRPFCGRSGKLLTEILAQAGLDRTEVYITNLVKCRPPNNRVPNTLEVHACHEHISQEIQELKPRVIVLLGASPVMHLLSIKNPKMTELHGSIFKYPSVPEILVMPFFHPAYLLRARHQLPRAALALERIIVTASQ